MYFICFSLASLHKIYIVVTFISLFIRNMARDKLIEVKEKDGESLETAYERTVPLA